MNAKVAKILIWLLGLVGLLIVYLVDKNQLEDSGVRLFANEMIIMTIAGVVSMLLAIIIVGGLLGLAICVFWVMGLVYIIQDKDQPLPLIGNWNWFFK